MLVVQNSEMVRWCKGKSSVVGNLELRLALKVGKSQSGKSLAKSALLIPSSCCADQTISIQDDDEDEDEDEDGVGEINKDHGNDSDD